MKAGEWVVVLTVAGAVVIPWLVGVGEIVNWIGDIIGALCG